MRPVILLAVLCSACAQAPSAPTTVAAKPAALEMDYDINVPYIEDVQYYRDLFPNGVRISPIAAQERWNYTRAYGGSPNVYYGPTTPHCEYVRAGIVVAPYAAASIDMFTVAQWPSAGLQPGATYVWVGRFAFTRVPAPGTYFFNPDCVQGS